MSVQTRPSIRRAVPVLLVFCLLSARLAAEVCGERQTLYTQEARQAAGPGVRIQGIAAPQGPGEDDSEAADDFEVPQGEIWSIDEVHAAGFSVPVQTNVPESFKVAFHLDAAGRPGEEVCSYPNVAPVVDLDAAGVQQLRLPLPSPCTVCSGRRFWLSLEALGAGDTEYSWRQARAQTLGAAVWRNPGNGLGTGCTDWSSPAACRQGDGVSADLVFSLEGRMQAPRFVKGDFDGDRCADLVFQSQSTGEIMIWFMNGTVRVGSPQLLSHLPDPGWTVAGTHDFNHDGRNDLVLQDPQEHVVLWMMDGVERIGAAPGLNTPSSPDRRIVATAGFASSADPDLVCHGSKGKVVIWDMIWNPGTQTWKREGGAFIEPEPEVGSQVDAALDFNGDHRLDLLLSETSSSEVSIWLLDDLLELQDTRNTTPSAPAATGWRVAAAADFGVGPDGPEAPAPACGALDLVWQNNSSYKTVVWHLDGDQERTGGLYTVPDGPGPGWLLVGPR